jgi:hypothetical protein
LRLLPPASAMPDGLPRFCVFGDSHFACLKQAELQGLVDVSGLEVEHWGHVGGRFLHLEVRDGAIHPKDDFTARRFAKFNERNRTFLPAADFDAILVMGARSYMLAPFQMIMRARYHGPFLSTGLKRRIVADSLRRQLGYRFAMGLAETATARIMLAPTSFPTEGLPGAASAVTEEMANSGPEARDEIWALATEAAAKDGITIIPQPEETLARGLMTKAAYAVDDHVTKGDYAHRNAAYGALILTRAIGIVRNMRSGV